MSDDDFLAELGISEEDFVKHNREIARNNQLSDDDFEEVTANQAIETETAVARQRKYELGFEAGSKGIEPPNGIFEVLTTTTKTTANFDINRDLYAHENPDEQIAIPELTAKPTEHLLINPDTQNLVFNAIEKKARAIKNAQTKTGHKNVSGLTGYIEGLETKFMPEHGIIFDDTIPAVIPVRTIEEILSDSKAFSEFDQAIQLHGLYYGDLVNPYIVAGRILGYVIGVARETGLVINAGEVPLTTPQYKVWMNGFNATEKEIPNGKKPAQQTFEEEVMYMAGLRIWLAKNGGQHIPAQELRHPTALKKCKETLIGGDNPTYYGTREVSYYLTLAKSMDPQMKMYFLRGGPVAHEIGRAHV